MNKIFNILISHITTAIILVIGIVAMAVATFIENDFGAEVARKAVYNAHWFEGLMILFSINLIGSIFKRKLYRKQKLTIFMFHISFIVMILGAGFTRYIGYEGTMHIRENASSSSIITQNKALNIKLVKSNKTKYFNYSESKLIKKSGFSTSFEIEDNKFNIKLVDYHANAIEKAVSKKGGKPIIGLVLAGNNYQGSIYITQGETKLYGNTIIAFDSKNQEADIYFTQINDTIFIGGKSNIIVSSMGADKSDLVGKEKAPVAIKKLYNTGNYNVVVREMYNEAVIASAANNSNTSYGNSAFNFDVSNNETTQTITLWESDYNSPQSVELMFGNTTFIANFGNQVIELPFELYLDDFEVKRYPGSGSPSSYSSYVHIIKPHEKPVPFHIYMNNILQTEGYRFYQSSYDNDEKGTVLSVNYDSLGTTVTYIGYFFMFLGIILSMISKNTFLRNTTIPKSLLVIIGVIGLLITTPLKSDAQNSNGNKKYISVEHANTFGTLLIQDNKGRTEPVYTFASDLLRKLSRKDKMFGLNPVQVFVEMNMDYAYWMKMPLIKISNRELQRYIGIKSNYASYADFIVPQKGYKLQQVIEKAYNTSPGKQSKFDKAVIKADERMNICYSIFSGTYLKMFPLPESDNHKWYSAHEATPLVNNSDDSTFLANILPAYFQQLEQATRNGDYTLANEFMLSIGTYQQKYAGYELPSDFKVNMEVKYYKWNVFKWLFPFYATIGVVFLFVLLGGIITGKGVSKWVSNTFFAIIVLGFIVHVLGLAARWYIAGHAPMSNGYESLVFISLITMLAGLIFSRQSLLALSATSVLAGFTLMVANLSFMDPEITNLVPVLKSYWLTIHVSVITGSYGFLGLGAILGIMNLVLTIVQNKDNYQRIEDTIAELTKINHRTLILGLYFLTIGTFLGAVWANESWGRYWGWDPKETWSLITILVYTFVTHARMIPGVKGIFAFNTLSIYAFFSVLMTYFGVNYYLSGLHSYAAGDPVPIPTFVYYSVAAIITLSVVAYFRFVKTSLTNK